MHILFIGKMPPIQGGVSRDGFWIVCELRRAGHVVDVVTNANHVEEEFRTCSDSSVPPKKILELSSGNSSTWTYVDSFARANYIPFARPYVSAIAGAAIESIKNRRPDVIVAYYFEPYAVAASIAAQVSAVPYVLMHAGSDVGRLMLHAQLGETYRQVARGAAGIFVSQRTYRRFLSIGVNPSNLSLTPRVGLPAEYFKPRAQSSDTSREFTVGMYGKIGRTKGTFDLLEAVSRLRVSGISVRVRLMVGGTAQNKERLLEAIRRLQLDDVTEVQGFRNHWEVPEFITECDAICFLERDFSIPIHRPLVPLEVMSCAVPLVVSREISGRAFFGSELVDRVNCIIVDPKSIELDQALSYLAADPCRSAELGKRGRALYERVEQKPNRFEAVFISAIRSFIDGHDTRRNQMSLGEFQACLARLYTSRSMRQLFSLDSQAAIRDYDLTAEEVTRLEEIDKRLLNHYAHSLIAKTRRLLEERFPVLVGLLSKATWHSMFDRYYHLFPRSPWRSLDDHFIDFLEFAREFLRSADDVQQELPYLDDYLRYLCQSHRLAVTAYGRDKFEWINLAEPFLDAGDDVAIGLCEAAVLFESQYDISKLIQGNSSEEVAHQPLKLVIVARPDRSRPDAIPVGIAMFKILSQIDEKPTKLSMLLAEYGQGDHVRGSAIRDGIAALVRAYVIERKG